MIIRTVGLYKGETPTEIIVSENASLYKTDNILTIIKCPLKGSLCVILLAKEVTLTLTQVKSTCIHNLVFLTLWIKAKAQLRAILDSIRKKHNGTFTPLYLEEPSQTKPQRDYGHILNVGSVQ